MPRLSRRTFLAAITLALGQAACADPSSPGPATPTGSRDSIQASRPPLGIPAGPAVGPTVPALATPGLSPTPASSSVTPSAASATPAVDALERPGTNATTIAGQTPGRQRILPGIDVLLAERLDLVQGKRVGLVTNPTGVTASGESSIDVIHRQPGLRLVALFGPEHGIRGEAQDGVAIASTVDQRTGVPIYSLYGETKRPTTEMLKGLDVVLFDVQDVGTRFYTYASTLAYVMEAAVAQGKPVVVLDRPNPIGGVAVEGPVLERGQESFVGLYPIALRHGMTIGELARLFNGAFGIDADLTVVPVGSWRRGDWFDQTGLPWVRPSPNLPTLTAATLYPASGLLEATNVAEGRGTPRPFENVGAPWIDGARWAAALDEVGLAGVKARPTEFTPDSRKYRGERCGGVFLDLTDRDQFRAVETGLHLIATARQIYPKHFAWRDGFDLMVGNAWLRQRLAAGATVADLAKASQRGLDEFRSLRERFLLYPS